MGGETRWDGGTVGGCSGGDRVLHWWEIIEMVGQEVKRRREMVEWKWDGCMM